MFKGKNKKLFEACVKNDRDEVRKLLKKKVDINKRIMWKIYGYGRRWSCLGAAIRNGKADIVELLVQDPRLEINGDHDKCDTYPVCHKIHELFFFSYYKGEDVVRIVELILRHQSAKLSSTSRVALEKLLDEQKLILACQNNDLRTMKMLIRKGTDVNAKMYPGDKVTALSLARSTEIKQYLTVDLPEEKKKEEERKKLEAIKKKEEMERKLKEREEAKERRVAENRRRREEQEKKRREKEERKKREELERKRREEERRKEELETRKRREEEKKRLAQLAEIRRKKEEEEAKRRKKEEEEEEGKRKRRAKEEEEEERRRRESILREEMEEKRERLQKAEAERERSEASQLKKMHQAKGNSRKTRLFDDHNDDDPKGGAIIPSNLSQLTQLRDTVVKFDPFSILDGGLDPKLWSQGKGIFFYLPKEKNTKKVLLDFIREHKEERKEFKQKRINYIIKKQPFASGGERYAYIMKVLGIPSFENKVFVAKRFQKDDQNNGDKQSGNDSSFSATLTMPRPYVNMTSLHKICGILASFFCKKLHEKGEKGVKLKYIPSFLLMMETQVGNNRTKRVICSLEEALKGDWERFNDNSGSFADNFFHAIPQAFSHFTYDVSDGYCIVCDVQGVCVSEKEYILSDPAIHTVDMGMYESDGNLTNLGVPGIHACLKVHKCNEYCKLLGLKEIKIEELEKEDEDFEDDVGLEGDYDIDFDEL